MSGLLGQDAASTQKQPARLPIIDTHQHLWDLTRFKLPWLQDAPEILRRNYRTAEYLQATRGLNLQSAIYMEVDVDPKQHRAEAEYVVGLGQNKDNPTRAAVIGGRPAAADFPDYIKRILKHGRFIKGIRQVLHSPTTKAGFCLQPDFVRGIRHLGEHRLAFDLCMRPTELGDGIRLSELCPDTRFILDHCGNADPSAFRRKPAGNVKPTHQADPWRRDLERFAKRPNVICKISGIVARAAKGWTAADLAPIVNHCLDVFGPDRVIFGGDWPVCLLGASFAQWVDALRQIVASRPVADQRKLWAENASRFYDLPRTGS